MGRLGQAEGDSGRALGRRPGAAVRVAARPSQGNRVSLQPRDGARSGSPWQHRAGMRETVARRTRSEGSGARSRPRRSPAPRVEAAGLYRPAQGLAGRALGRIRPHPPAAPVRRTRVLDGTRRRLDAAPPLTARLGGVERLNRPPARLHRNSRRAHPAAGWGGRPGGHRPSPCLRALHIPAPIFQHRGGQNPGRTTGVLGGLGRYPRQPPCAPCSNSGPPAGPFRRWREAWSEMSRSEGNRRPLTHPVEQWCAPCRIAVPRGPLHIARASPAHPPARRLSIAPRDGCEGRKDRSNGRIPGKRRGRTRARADISSSSPSQPPHGVRNTRGINGLSQRRGAIASPARPPHFSRPVRYAAGRRRGDASCKERGG